MKKIIFFLFLLTSCSLNSNSAYWNENTNFKFLKVDDLVNVEFDYLARFSIKENWLYSNQVRSC